MTHKEARFLIHEIEKTQKNLNVWEKLNIKNIRQRLASDTKITHGESMSLQECYCRTQKGEF